MKSIINENYRGMDINCYPSRTQENKDTNMFEVFWMIEAYKNGELKGSWEYSAFRVEPQNPSPLNTYFSASPNDIKQSGRDLIDKLISEGI